MEEQDEQIENYLKRLEELEPYTIEQVDDFILNRWAASEIVDDELKDYLSIRKRKINDTFEWTSENCEKLLHLNQKLINCFEKLRDEAKSVIKTLKKRINEKDDFLHDYNISAKVTPYFYMPDETGTLYEAETGMERILMDSMYEDRYVLLYCWMLIDEEDADEMIYLNKEMNWSDEPRFKGKFDGYFIFQAIHELYDHTYLSFPDILKINRLWAELEVTHQHFEGI
jgi:hypothetical protein